MAVRLPPPTSGTMPRARSPDAAAPFRLASPLFSKSRGSSRSRASTSPTRRGVSRSGTSDDFALHDGVVDAVTVERLLMRQRIGNMFRLYFPAKMHRLAEALARCSGREEHLLASLVGRLGPEPAFSQQQQHLADVILGRVSTAVRLAEGQRSPPLPPVGLTDDGSPHVVVVDPAEEPARWSSQLPGRSPRRGDVETFPSAVAHSTVQHYQRCRALEFCMARRVAVAQEEDACWEALGRQMLAEERTLQSQSHRSASNISQHRKLHDRREAEVAWAARRQQAVLTQRLERQAAADLQRFLAFAAELQAEERLARRTEYQTFLDTAAVLLREEKHKERLRKVHDAAIDQAHRALENHARIHDAEERMTVRRQRMAEEEMRRAASRKQSEGRMESYVQKMRQKFRLLEQERLQEAARVQEELVRRRSTARLTMGCGLKFPLGAALSETLGSRVDDEDEGEDDTMSAELLSGGPRVADLLPSLSTR